MILAGKQKVRWCHTQRPSPFFSILLFILLLSGCGTTTQKPTPAASAQTPALDKPYTFIDSTEYFADRTASVSMRATFDTTGTATMSTGYKFQFRSISKSPIFLSSMSIIAGGKRFFVEKGQVTLTNNKSVTLTLPLEDSQFIGTFPSALLQFKHNNLSHILTITLHQLQEFIPQH